MKPGVMAAIIIGALVGIGLIAAVIWWFCRRAGRKREFVLSQRATKPVERGGRM